MLQERPLSRLGAYVAAARARGRPTRLVLRNSDAFGLVHLYFQQGHLVAVEGYRGPGRSSLAAVASWANGTIRQDDLDNQALNAEVDPSLDHDLDALVRAFQARAATSGPLSPGPFSPPGPVNPTTSGPYSALPNAFASPLPPASVPPGHGATGGGGRTSLPSLPSLDDVPRSTGAPARAGVSGQIASRGVHGQPSGMLSTGDITETAPTAKVPQPLRDPALFPLSTPQWQMLVLMMHQIVDRASEDVGAPVAAGFLLQALNRLSNRSFFLAGLQVDEGAWIHAQPTRVQNMPSYEVTTAIAELMMAYEGRCATMVGEEAARRIIVEATAPLRQGLAQVGLDVAAS